MSLLWEFFSSADRQGLRLPEDSQGLREVLRENISVKDDMFEAIESGKMPWPPSYLLSLMALAQHYGVPTRLLDWTSDPYIAAYFAASSAEADATSICVWSFSAINSELQEIVVRQEKRTLLFVSAPASDNENLRAQRWVGLLYRHAAVPLHKPPLYESFDEVADESFSSGTIFWKLTVPTGEAGEILRLLSALNIDASAVFPGFYGVARAVNEMSRWPDQAEWRSAPQYPKKLYWAQQEALFERHPELALRARVHGGRGAPK